jgi:ribosomal protein S18 acetylase RimI-like enzyme
MKIIIRDATKTDITAISELFDLYRQFYEQPADICLAKEFITDRFTSKESVIIVAEHGESGLIGFCQLYPIFCSIQAKPIYSLSDLFVVPLARNSGAGRLLLQAAEARAAADGKVQLELTTAKTNKSAQSLYESLGWQRDEVYFAYSLQLQKQ